MLGGVPEIFWRKKFFYFVLKRYKTWGHFFQKVDFWGIGFGFEFDWWNHTSGAGAATCIWISVDLDFQQINSVHRNSTVHQFKTYCCDWHKNQWYGGKRKQLKVLLLVICHWVSEAVVSRGCDRQWQSLSTRPSHNPPLPPLPPLLPPRLPPAASKREYSQPGCEVNSKPEYPLKNNLGKTLDDNDLSRHS